MGPVATDFVCNTFGATDIPDFIVFTMARLVFKKMKAFLGAINVFFIEL